MHRFALIEVSNMPSVRLVATGDYETVMAAIPGRCVIIEPDKDNAGCWDALASTGQLFVIEHVGTPLARRLLA